MTVHNIHQRILQQKRLILVEYMGTQIPSFRLKSKDDSILFGILGKLAFWNPHLNTRFITTLYPHIYVPGGVDDWQHHNPATAIEILAHEYVHLKDRKKLGWLFNLLYLSPQIFSLLALMAFFNPWFLLSLLCLLPLPSPGRAWLEFRGYRMSMAVHYWTRNRCIDIDWIVSQFAGSNYYFMLPLRKLLTKAYEREFEKIKNNDLTSELEEVKSLLRL